MHDTIQREIPFYLQDNGKKSNIIFVSKETKPFFVFLFLIMVAQIKGRQSKHRMFMIGEVHYIY